ncbi:hypothetical protein [Blautia obeum]|uniref:hypothetical protein n=1 Tax=Blautia obeum TaxID=40520 RepID=UPI000E4404FB|nr:hypothetical protein [Blautia obeum]RGI92224.1 hypothetical protein DXD81_08590 [Blautia obeum]
MTEEDILFISRLIEPQIVETCHQTEEELLEHLQLDRATAYKAVTLALQNIIMGRNSIQLQRMYVYADSDLLTPVMEVDLQ